MNDSQNIGDRELIERLASEYAAIKAELAKAIIGQEETIEQVITALVAGGHCLLVGVPGLAKTLLVHSLASTLKLDFSRIQFTPDLMPSDITGTEVIQQDRETGERQFKFLPGPIFGNIILADEINRTPPKTQAALLEAMQERQVTAGGTRHELPNPFFVLATQNPIEQDGTYPLPEAQLDRFMFDVRIDYPNEADELQVVLQTTDDKEESLTAVVDGAQLLEFRHLVRRIPIAEPVARYAMTLARGSRPSDPRASDQVKKYVRWGSGPRGSQYLVLAAKARAALQGRHLVERDDVDAVALPVLRHRIRLNFAAEADGLTVAQVIQDLIQRARHGAEPAGVAAVFRNPTS
ncbi:ATPase RavA [Rosistilla ulvae]|uniref:ATPase RavA n=2 Tax=Rosistilla TaxID=2795779 RepID=A0A517LW12_9BACT|nr:MULTISPECIES: MoxR family ATPase [Rosistilla]QDS86789.1 ATPase RavA [Rosistilla ulvae]QDV66996.1 ATPase RavA [Rosistilla carotiformis]